MYLVSTQKYDDVSVKDKGSLNLAVAYPDPAHLHQIFIHRFASDVNICKP